MSHRIEIKVPNIGEFTGVEVIDILVKPGDRVKVEDPLITLESDKATMDIPATAAGVVSKLEVAVGERVSEGDLILIMDVAEEVAKAPAASRSTSASSAEFKEITAEIMVLGSGPGGYTAAFRAADLGKRVVLVERYPTLGGVCLNVGCIPSKALLHAAKVICDSREMADAGIEFGAPKINLDKLRAWKERVLGQLTNGLKGLAKQRRVEVVQGEGQFIAPNRLRVESGAGEVQIHFEQAIIAAGSQAAKIPGVVDDPRIMDSTGGLALADIPGRLLVIGGGIIGLELATVYSELGSRVTIVEMLESLLTGVDRDLVKPLERRIKKQYENIYLGTRVREIIPEKDGLTVRFEGPKAPEQDMFERVLVAIGRRPNGHYIGAEHAGIIVNDAGFIPVDNQLRTNVPHIFAIGDIVGQPMLAHKAVHEGKVAAEVAAGLKRHFDAQVIPAVAYTDPEVAWAGVTETEAVAQGLDYDKGVFPWAASGRSLSLGRGEGMTKLLFDNETRRVIGAGITGPNAGDLIAEATLAIEMGCVEEDIGLTIHPHPTLSETIAFAAEAYAGTITDLYMPKNRQG